MDATTNEAMKVLTPPAVPSTAYRVTASCPGGRFPAPARPSVIAAIRATPSASAVNAPISVGHRAASDLSAILVILVFLMATSQLPAAAGGSSPGPTPGGRAGPTAPRVPAA